MSKIFNIGDEVVILSGNQYKAETAGISHHNIVHGMTPLSGSPGIVVDYECGFPIVALINSKEKFGFEESNLSLIKSNKVMNPIAKELVDANTQVLMEAGLIDPYLNLTGDGRAQLDAMNFAANKDALVAIAKAKIAARTK